MQQQLRLWLPPFPKRSRGYAEGGAREGKLKDGLAYVGGWPSSWELEDQQSVVGWLKALQIYDEAPPGAVPLFIWRAKRLTDQSQTDAMDV